MKGRGGYYELDTQDRIACLLCFFMVVLMEEKDGLSLGSSSQHDRIKSRMCSFTAFPTSGLKGGSSHVFTLRRISESKSKNYQGKVM